jgi:hypothetical protein
VSQSVAPAVSRGRLTAARSALANPETLRSIGLAGAMVASNVVALGLTVVFGRILGPAGYGSVAALTSTFLIVGVPGNALQLATARAGSLGELGHGPGLHATLDGWTRRLLVLAVLVAVASALARAPLAAIMGVDQRWAAAAVPVTAVLWVLLCVQRGAFQAVGAYKVVGVSMVLEQIARLAIGTTLALAGLDATGAYLGAPLGIGLMAVGLGVLLQRRLAPAGRVTGARPWAPSSASRSSAPSRTSTSSSPTTASATTPPAPIPAPPSRPRSRSGSPSASPSASSPKPPAAPPRARTPAASSDAGCSSCSSRPSPSSSSSRRSRTCC